MKRTTGVRDTSVRAVLTETGGFIDGFTHSLNPYMGCAFGERGCGAYCYVAESPIGLYAGIPWGTWVEVKTNAAEVLRRELARIPDPRGVRVFMSSATDPYQPREREAGVTRRILEVFRERPIGLLVVQTRSPIVERDLDLLAGMPFAWLSMTVETDDDEVRRALTPACPSIDRRFATLRAARAAGVQVQVTVSPALPHHREVRRSRALRGTEGAARGRAGRLVAGWVQRARRPSARRGRALDETPRCPLRRPLRGRRGRRMSGLRRPGRS